MIALVLPTVIINMLDSGIAHFITDERVNSFPIESLNIESLHLGKFEIGWR